MSAQRRPLWLLGGVWALLAVRSACMNLDTAPQRPLIAGTDASEVAADQARLFENAGDANATEAAEATIFEMSTVTSAAVPVPGAGAVVALLQRADFSTVAWKGWNSTTQRQTSSHISPTSISLNVLSIPMLVVGLFLAVLWCSCLRYQKTPCVSCCVLCTGWGLISVGLIIVIMKIVIFRMAGPDPMKPAEARPATVELVVAASTPFSAAGLNTPGEPRQAYMAGAQHALDAGQGSRPGHALVVGLTARSSEGPRLAAFLQRTAAAEEPPGTIGPTPQRSDGGSMHSLEMAFQVHSVGALQPRVFGAALGDGVTKELAKRGSNVTNHHLQHIQSGLVSAAQSPHGALQLSATFHCSVEHELSGDVHAATKVFINKKRPDIEHELNSFASHTLRYFPLQVGRCNHPDQGFELKVCIDWSSAWMVLETQHPVSVGLGETSPREFLCSRGCMIKKELVKRKAAAIEQVNSHLGGASIEPNAFTNIICAPAVPRDTPPCPPCET